MDYENMYERYGLGGNPFQKQAKNRYKTISESHVDLALDDEIARIKKSVFKHKKTEIVFLVGKEGMGKTERVLVCQKEAEMNNFSYVSIPLSTHNGCAMKLFLDEVSPKGSALLSNDKWEREVSKLKKVVHKGYDASRVAGLLVDAFKKRVPGFLLIDDLHMVLNAVDAQLFIQALSILIKQAPPGIFILITADKKKVSGLLNVFSNLRSLFSHPLEIAPLTDENTWRIISKKIESKRMVSEISNGYPFAESSVSYLNELAKGNPKKILAAANIVLTAAAFQKVYLISDEFQKETFNHLKSKPWFISSSFKVKTDLLISMENLDIVSSDKKPILQGKKEKIKPDFSGPEKKSIFKKSVKPLKSGDNGSDKNPYKSINVASELPVDKKQTVKKPVEKKVTIEIDESSDRIDSDFDNKLQNPSHLVSTNYALDPSFPKDRIMNFKIPKRQLEAISVKSNKTLSSKKKKETNFVKAKDLDNESIKRFVKAKCPECNHVFSTKILAKNRELVCPECGFVGEY